MGLHAQQLQQRIQDLERDKAVSAEREQDFDRMRQALEEKDRELEMKLAEATMIIQQSGGGAAAGGAGAGDGAGRGSSLERQLDKLVQSQPVAVRLPGLDSLDEDNKLRFFQLLLQEDSGILYQNEEVEVHWLQSFPFTNDDFYHHAERGLLAGRVDLKLFSKGFESIHLKCTNNDVKGLKVVPLPISAAASTKEAGPPQVIIQTICVELLELLEAHPFVKCDITVLDSQTRIEHDCTFALPIVLLKFCLPWEVDATDLTEFAKTCPRNCVAQAAGIFYREVLSDDFPLNLLTFGGILSEVERTMDRITLATSLVRHGVCKKDLNVVIYLQASKIEVLSHDKRLSEIVLYTLQDYFAFATKNLADMEQMYK
ncbi:unnamed protein product [Amoebophrya sp. A25]|nr:unnamed protein product [Amoebophrya sp. A25]|eukprot:GSA25T00011004001.1